MEGSTAGHHKSFRNEPLARPGPFGGWRTVNAERAASVSGIAREILTELALAATPLITVQGVRR
jgi:hypothetical protein